MTLNLNSAVTISDEKMQAHRDETLAANRHSDISARSRAQWKSNTTGSAKPMTRSFVRSTPNGRGNDGKGAPLCDHVSVFEYEDGTSSTFDGKEWRHHKAPTAVPVTA